jgi:PAS domain S-box-containing protein
MLRSSEECEPRARVIIVEDDKTVAADLESRLQILGFTVSGNVTTAEAAIERAATDPPDLVLAELGLQGDRDGIESAEMIRTELGVPVVFITAHADHHKLALAKPILPFSYIVRPFQDRDIEITLDMAVYVARANEERVRVEAALRESEELHRLTLGTISDAVLITDNRGDFTFICPNIDIIFGYTFEEVSQLGNIKRLLGKRLFDAAELERLGEIANIERTVTDKHGRHHWLLVNVKLVSIKGGTTLYTCHDISDRKQVEIEQKRAQEALLAEQRISEKLLNAQRDTVFVFDPESGKAIKWNHAFRAVSGYSDEEIAAMKAPESWYDEADLQRAAEATRVLMSRGQPTVEMSLITKSGARIPFEYLASMVEDQGSGPLVIAVGRDISKRKLVLERLRSALHEKEALLREIHHRVKNNLQVISSLLSLQANAIESEEGIQALRESGNRVRSMARVHEQVYRSDRFEEIHLEEYLNLLVDDLKQSWQGKAVSVTVKGHAVLPVDKAVPCGLVANELVANAFQHAFPTRQPGTVVIEVGQQDSQYHLDVADDGVGLAKEIDLETTSSLGLRLAKILTRQLNGRLEAETDKGTTFKLTFPV